MTLIKQTTFLLGNNRKKIPWLLCLFFANSMIELIGIGLIGPYMILLVNPEAVLDSGLGRLVMQYFSFSEVNDLVVPASLSLISVFFIKAMLAIAISQKIIKFGLRLETEIRCSLMTLYQNINYTDYLRRNSSQYIVAIGNYVSSFTNGILTNLLRMISEGVSVLAIIILLAFSDLNILMFLVALIVGVMLLHDRLFKLRSIEYGKIINSNRKILVQGISEAMEGLKELRVLGKEKYFHQVVQRSTEQIALYTGKTQMIALAPRYLLELILITFIVVIVLFSTWKGADLKDVVPILSVFAVSAIRLIPSINILISGRIMLNINRNATSLIYQDLISQKNSFNSKAYELCREPVSEVFETLNLNQVSFSYPDTSSNALNKVSLSITKGECIGLIGTSGSGKTTLIDTILGLLEPQSGAIEFNGKPLQDNIHTWHENVAYLPQDMFSTDNTLRCNVALGVWEEDIDDELLEKALDQAQLTEWVEQLPEGLETVIGERGVLLSGGQRQRIALARSFYHDRSFLIMDESTSALDGQTDAEIVSEIKSLKGSKTMIVIAHRLSTIEHCDRLYRIENGKIVAQGSYESVVGKKT